MGFIVRFAFKNIWRYKKRTIITFTAISVGIAAFLFLDSMLKGVHYESLRNFIDYESGHLKIFNREFYDEMTNEGFLMLDKGIDNYKEIGKFILDKGMSFAPRITFNAHIINEEIGGERPFNVIAIEPEYDKNVYKLSDTIISGRFLKSDERGMIIGRLSAEKMSAELGTMLTILTRTKNDTYQTISFEVVGIMDPPNPNINKSVVYIPLDVADQDLQMEGSVTEIGIRLKSDNEDEKFNLIGDMLKDSKLLVVSWKELGKDWLTLSKTKTTASYVMIFMVFIISAIGVINTMLMSVFERVREIGMMRALGMRDSEVLFSFIFEGAIIGFFGAVLGLIIGAILNLYLIYHGINLSALNDMDLGYRVMNVMRGVWNPGSFLFAFVFSIVAPAIISIYPSRKAINIEVIQALRA
ncbi:MAG: ABC transporter permease [bacterium]